MKVTREEVVPVFVPVTITLESQSEIDLLVALLGGTNRRVVSSVVGNADVSYDMYNKLYEFATYGVGSKLTVEVAKQ